MRPILTLTIVSALSASALAGVTVSPLVLAGDIHNGFAIATGFAAAENLAINNSGVWRLETDNDNPDTNADGLVLTGAGAAGPITVYWAEGQLIPDPAGAAIGSFDAITINNNANSGFNIFLDNLTTTTDSGVFYNNTLIIQESDIATAAGFSANTPYIGWFEVLINDDDDLLMLASVDDPAITSTVDRAIVRIDEPLGAATQTVLLKEGDEVVTGRFLTDVTTTSAHNISFQTGSQVLLVVDLDGDTVNDSAVYYYDGTSWGILAREGDPSHIAGRNWASLASAPVSLNAGGGWAMRGTLSAPTTDDSIIVRNGTTTVAQEGSPVPAIPAFNFTGFGTGAVTIDSSGGVFYYGTWNDPDTTRNKGLFRNDQLLAQTGVTMIGAEVISDISAVQDNFATSSNGRFLIFEGVLTDPVNMTSRRGAFLIEISAFCPADFNQDGAVSVQDIFDYLAAFFGNCDGTNPNPPCFGRDADFNGSGAISPQDIFDYLAAFFTPCE